MNCFFVSDLHGNIDRYEKLFRLLEEERPFALFFGGDLLPSPYRAMKTGKTFHENFTREFLVDRLNKLKQTMGNAFPVVFAILGNDDARTEEAAILEAEKQGVLKYCHNRRISWEGFTVYGYTNIPPSPFLLKDWERYDVTDYVRPGCVPPEEGAFTVQVEKQVLITSSIEKELKALTGEDDLGKAIFLFHSPPHGCKLDRAALDGRRIDGVQVDMHVGSTAIRRFIETRRPMLTLHGHIHESTRITGSWKERFNDTVSFNGSHDGPELSLVRFNPYCLNNATRELI
jgi:Icc-related predicted phosphoesterase